MASAILPTLGPVPHGVAVSGSSMSDPPDILDSGALIARRALQIVDPWACMGAMLARHVAWSVFESTGDGSASAVALLQGLLHPAHRYIAAGASPVLVGQGITAALPCVIDALEAQARPVESRVELARVVFGVVRDHALSAMIAEVVESVGVEGAVLIEDARGAESGYEYVDGATWNEGYASAHFVADGQQRANVVDARVLLTTCTLDHAEALLPTLEACIAADQRRLVVIAPAVRDAALRLLLANREAGVLEQVLAVSAPLRGDQQVRVLEDLAVLTGGRCMRTELGDTLAHVTLADLGTAREVWSTRGNFGILGGHGAPGALGERIKMVRAELRNTTDDETRQLVRERLGKLSGTAAVIRVGTFVEAERVDRRMRLQAGVRAARAALEHGIVPGGGAALVACLPALGGAQDAGDRCLGVRAVADALLTPMRTIVANSGCEPEPVLCAARSCAPGATFDAIQRKWVDARAAGGLDVLDVVRMALQASIGAGVVALQSELLVRRRNPPLSITP